MCRRTAKGTKWKEIQIRKFVRACNTSRGLLLLAILRTAKCRSGVPFMYLGD